MAEREPALVTVRRADGTVEEWVAIAAERETWLDREWTLDTAVTLREGDSVLIEMTAIA